MKPIEKLGGGSHQFDIDRDNKVSVRTPQPGPPQRIDGYSMGIITMSENAPHGGELHPDGDEILYVISGKLRVRAESDPDHPVELIDGDACLVRQGEWHQVDVLEVTQLMYLTPGPNGDHRPLPNEG